MLSETYSSSTIISADSKREELGSAKGRIMETSSEDIPFTLPPRLFQNSSVLKCIDCHAGGEPARVVLSGAISLLDSECITALDKRSYMMKHLDYLRKVLLLEPRGYPCQNANFIFRPPEPDGNIQYVIAEQNKIYPLMSGHNTICVATALLECGVIPMQTPTTEFTLESPGGPIKISACCADGKAQSITFKNAPSFVEKLDAIVDVPHVGPVKCDIAFGGMWYAVVDLEQFATNPILKHLNMRFDPDNAAELCRVGEMIKVACKEQYPVQHPSIDYPGVDILVFREKPTKCPTGGVQARNTVPMSNNILDWDRPETWTAMLDRSPCGTGTCAVMAVMHRRGELKVGEPFFHSSIVGSTFTGTILEETCIKADDDTIKPAILPQIEGSAWLTQYSEVVVDPQDPFQEGYRVGDIW